jgi:Fic family protein
MLLGEARSKCEHLAGVPLRPSTAYDLHKIYLAKGVLATTAIEGNTLSEDEVHQLLEGSLKLPPSKKYLAQEVDNVIKACTRVWNDVDEGRPFKLTPENIKRFNREVLQDLEVEKGVVPGDIRSHPVGVFTYRGAPAQDLDYLLDRMCSWLSSDGFAATTEDGIVPAIFAAMMAHLYLAWIHPFGDGNGRTARLVEFAILVSAGVPSPAAHLLSNHYNETRSKYYRELAYASQSKGDVTKFIHYGIQGFVDGLKAQIARIRQQQLDVEWENFVHQHFSEHKSATSKRKRDLVLNLSTYRKPISLHAFVTLPEMKLLYEGRTTRTMYRDIVQLVHQQFVAYDKGTLRARKERIEAFLPSRNNVAQSSLPDELRDAVEGRSKRDTVTAQRPVDRSAAPPPKKGGSPFD